MNQRQHQGSLYAATPKLSKGGIMVSIIFKPAHKALQGNSKSRYKERRREKQEMQRSEAALQRRIEEAVAGCSIKVVRAVSAPPLRKSQDVAYVEYRMSSKYQKVCNEAGRTIHAVQKRKGQSIPAYFD